MAKVFIDSVNKLWEVSDKGTIWLSAFRDDERMLICPIHDLFMFVKAPTHRYAVIIPINVWKQIVKSSLIISPPKLFKTEFEVQVALGLIDSSTNLGNSQERVWEVAVDKMEKCLENFTKNKEEINEIR